MEGPEWHAMAWITSLVVKEVRWPKTTGFVDTPGGNDLGLLQDKALVRVRVRQVLEDLGVIREHWPDVWVIWSTIIPRKLWRNAMDPRTMNKAYKNANREIVRVLHGGLGQFLPHTQISVLRMKLYRPDGVHLSEVDLDIFLADLK